MDFNDACYYRVKVFRLLYIDYVDNYVGVGGFLIQNLFCTDFVKLKRNKPFDFDIEY